mgnify:CR=1 FL=1
MLGFSVFLGEGLSESKQQYIEEMNRTGFTRIFTSLHIPEDDPQEIIHTLKRLGKLTQQLQMDLMADISSDGLHHLAMEFKQAETFAQLKGLGVTGVRMDYGIDNQTIAAISRFMKVGLNASTLTDEGVAELRSFQTDFKNIELWHNYYPRPETGLSRNYLQKINYKWRTYGFKIVAFVPGDENLRGPLHHGLPSLEMHRWQHPLAATLDLFRNYDCDAVYIGDSGLTKKVREQFNAYFQDKKLLLEIDLLTKNYHSLILGEHTNRIDEAEFVVRSQEARPNNQQMIETENIQAREKGAITVDNKKYLRYMGEVQITKVDLPVDERVNVVAKVVEKDRSLINYVGSGCRFELKEGRKM